LPEDSTEAVIAIEQALRAEEFAALAAAKADAWPNTFWFMQGIQQVHDAWGLPW
jgi:hypothetical protein